MSNKLIDELRACGVLTGSGKKDAAQPARQMTDQDISTPGMASVVHIFTQGLDQPAAAAPSEVEQARQAMLARAAYAAVANETAQQRFERARKRMVDAGMYR